MGYYTYITGGMVIEPALPADLTAPDGSSGEVDKSWWLLENQGVGETVIAKDGALVITGRSYTEVSMAFEESIKAYDNSALEAVTALVDLATEYGSIVNGAIFGDGEEPNDYWRIRIDNSVIVHEEAAVHLHWPNGDTTEI